MAISDLRIGKNLQLHRGDMCVLRAQRDLQVAAWPLRSHASMDLLAAAETEDVSGLFGSLRGRYGRAQPKVDENYVTMNMPVYCWTSSVPCPPH